MNRLVTLLFLLSATQISAQSMQWVSACANQSFCLDLNNCVQGNVLMTETAATNCNTSSLVNYSYKIDLESNGTIDIQAAGDTVTGNFIKGVHRITWRATDNCGHAITCAYVFTIKDCTPPFMICLNGSTQALTAPDCETTLFARQYVQSVTDNCTPSNQIQFGIRETGTGTGFPTDTSVSFRICQQGLHPLEVWSKDLNGLTSQCNTYVVIQQNGNACACNTNADISAAGCVRTVNNTRLSDYHVRLKVQSISGVTPAVTKEVAKATIDSCFTVTALKIPLNGTYRATIRAERFGNPLNGVTTSDLLAISKHILSIEPLQNAYQGIAADVNNSHTITAFDIIETRKLILGLYDSFPGTPSWRLVRPLADPTDFSTLAAIKDTYQIIVPNLTANVALAAFPFIAVKTGDVNLSVLGLHGEAESRGTPLALQIADQLLEAGEEITVPIQLGEAAKLSGWQLALRTDPTAIQITDVTGLADENYVRAADGSLRALWFDGHGQDFAAGDVIFTLKIKALRPIWLAQALVLDPSALSPEAYPDQHVRRPLLLNFQSKVVPKTTFFPPQPNPFAEETTFQYRLEQPGEATLEIFDAAGRLVYAQMVAGTAGMNSTSLPASALQNAGVYAFRLQAGGKIFTGRLVRM